MFRPALIPLALLALVVPGWTATSYADPPSYGPFGYTPGAYDGNGRVRGYVPPASGTVEPYGRYGYTPGAYDYSGSSASSGYRQSYSYSPSYRGGTSFGAGSGMASQPAAPDRKVHIAMRLPADAKVWFNGKEIAGQGGFRQFESPELTKDGEYAYNLKVSWKAGGKTVERTRRVIVGPGDYLALNFNNRGTANAATAATAR
jgi:uncharacterized protein (TIGR03000 family)